MSPDDLQQSLRELIRNKLQQSVMIWGPPGIGKSSIVHQVCDAAGLELIDLRLSQLAPTDIRGLPVPDGDSMKWLPPDFLPWDGCGVLSLDEINMALPAIQGIAQQLILDRRVGSYRLPDGWFIWAAGNKRSDYAAVHEMSAPLLNRFIHFDVGPSLDAFKTYAIARGFHEDVVGFLTFKPTLLHKLSLDNPQWPSPRSWEMASDLLHAGMSVEPAVGHAVAMEFLAYYDQKKLMPDIAQILAGDTTIKPPAEPSVVCALVTGLTLRFKDEKQAHHALRWVLRHTHSEWAHLFARDAFNRLRNMKRMNEFNALVVDDHEALALIDRFARIFD